MTLARPRSEGIEDRAAKKRRARKLVARLREAYPDAGCALVHENPLQLLIATILSAQCTDARVNKVTPTLFGRFPTARALAEADRAEVEELIRTTGFFRNKAKSIQGATAKLTQEFEGAVPRTMEELTSLPGVARKTANVVLGTAYGIADGFVVDTHVFRLSHRMGLAEGNAPEQVEKELMQLIPREDWIDLAHILIHHGRAVCRARGPRCEACVVQSLCPKRGVSPKAATAKTAKPPAAARLPLKARIAASRKSK